MQILGSVVSSPQMMRSSSSNEGESLMTAGLFLASVLMNLPHSKRRKRSLQTDQQLIQKSTENLFFKVLSDLDQEDCIAIAVCEASDESGGSKKDERNAILMNSLGIDPVLPVEWNHMDDFRAKYQYAGFVGRSMGVDKSKCKKAFSKCSLPNSDVLNLLTREINSCEEMLVSFDQLRQSDISTEVSSTSTEDPGQTSTEDSMQDSQTSVEGLAPNLKDDNQHQSSEMILSLESTEASSNSAVEVTQESTEDNSKQSMESGTNKQAEVSSKVEATGKSTTESKQTKTNTEHLVKSSALPLGKIVLMKNEPKSRPIFPPNFRVHRFDDDDSHGDITNESLDASFRSHESAEDDFTNEDFSRDVTYEDNSHDVTNEDYSDEDDDVFREFFKLL